MFDLMLFLHLLGVSAWFGGSLVGMFGSRTMTTGDSKVAAAWYRSMVVMGRFIHMPAALVVFITGFGLVGLESDRYEMTMPFVVVGILTVIASAALAMVISAPYARRAATLYEAGDENAARTTARRLASAGWVDLGLLVFAILVMVTRWGA